MATTVDTDDDLVYIPLMRVGSANIFAQKAVLLTFLYFHAVTAVAYVATGAVRASDLGIPFDGVPGELNAITDVRPVEVGHTTLVKGEGKLIVGSGPVRTGVTAILPLGKNNSDTPVPAAVFSFNGNGEMTGSEWVDESGFLEGPVLLTNTHSVGVVRDAVIEWGTRKFPGTGVFSLPVVGETWDGGLNDINGFHVKKEDVFCALDDAKGGAVDEGNVGGGTGNRAFGFKAGIGTASRVVAKSDAAFCVGVLVQANMGSRQNLIIAGVPVGKEITDLQPVIHRDPEREGSILVFIAFSTAVPAFSDGRQHWSTLKNDDLDPLLAATVEATEEAIINSLVAAKTMHGVNDNTFFALPHDRLREVLGKYNRLVGKEP